MATRPISPNDVEGFFVSLFTDTQIKDLNRLVAMRSFPGSVEVALAEKDVRDVLYPPHDDRQPSGCRSVLSAERKDEVTRMYAARGWRVTIIGEMTDEDYS
jgi:hypothetical protein